VSRELRWTEQAVAQLAAIVEYISVSSPVYAEHLVNRIVARLDQAVVYPESGRAAPEASTPDIRELLERPYRLMYRVRETRIEVIAVVHERRAPGSGGAD
jgi:plasmid stabilization system protein ParE